MHSSFLPKNWYIHSIQISLYDDHHKYDTSKNGNHGYHINDIVLMNQLDPLVKLSFAYKSSHTSIYHTRLATIYEKDTIVLQEEKLIYHQDLVYMYSIDGYIENERNRFIDEDESINIWLFHRKLPLLFKSSLISFYDEFLLLQIMPDESEFYTIIGPDYSYDNKKGVREILVYEHAVAHVKEILPMEMGNRLRSIYYSRLTYHIYSKQPQWQVSYIHYCLHPAVKNPCYNIKEICLVHPADPTIKIIFNYDEKPFLSYQVLRAKVLLNDVEERDYRMLIHMNAILNYSRLEYTSALDELNEWLYMRKLPILLKSMTFGSSGKEDVDFIYDETSHISFTTVSRTFMTKLGITAKCCGPIFYYQRKLGVQNVEVFKNTIYVLRNLFPETMGKRVEDAYHASMFDYVMRYHPVFHTRVCNVNQILQFINPFLASI